MKKPDRRWMQAHITDPYVKRSKQEGYRARSAYKLAQLDESLRLLRAGQVVVDLGATPGAWSQYVQRKMGAQVTLLALDLLPMEPVEGATFILGDFCDEAVQAQLTAALQGRTIDLLLSDMAPNLSGIAASDAARMDDLIERVQHFAATHLRAQGTLLVKCFQGSGYSQTVARFKQQFQRVKAIKPDASRAQSAEIYLLGQGLRVPPTA